MRYPRESLILQTKCAPKKDPAKFKADVLSSLANLQTEYLDLFAFHGVNLQRDLDFVLRKGGCLEVAQQLQKEGKIKVRLGPQSNRKASLFNRKASLFNRKASFSIEMKASLSPISSPFLESL